MSLGASYSSRGWSRDAIESLGPVEVRVTKSQVAFRRRRAWAWVPDRYLRGRYAPLERALSFPLRDDSQRWKQGVEPARERLMHRLELYTGSEIDDEVRRWLQTAWEAVA